MRHSITNRTMATALILALGIITSACHRGKSTTEFIDSARGRWQSGCQNFGIDREYGQVTINVQETSFGFTNRFYTDPQCAKPSISFSSDGELTKHDILSAGNSNAVAEIDFLIKQISATVLSVTKRNDYNNNAVCGRTDWQINTSVDVSNCVDILNTKVPRTEYDIYSVAKKTNAAGVATDVLYTGMLRGTTAALRPSGPDFQNPYWRIANEQVQ